jgi:hypothetical protein
MDDSLIDAARMVLFAVVGRKNQEFPQLRHLGEFLSRHVVAEAVVDGHKVPCRDQSGAASFAYASEKSVMRHRGLAPFYFHNAYEDAVMQYGVEHAQPDLEVLHRFVPESWVYIIADLIAEGPSLAGARAQVALYRYSKESVQLNRRRPEQPRSEAAVRNVRAEAHRIFEAIYELQALSVCQQWTRVHKLAMPTMDKGGYDTVAPRVETIRRVLDEMTSELHTRLRVETIEEELAAIEALSVWKVRRSGAWRIARDRALLVLMVLTGGRRGALARLTRANYIRDHVGPYPDYRKGGVLELTPRKGKGREEVRRKPIPPEVALILDSYLALMDRTIAASDHEPATATSPLLLAEPSHCRKQVREDWLYRRVAGDKKTRPLVPRDPDHLADHLPFDRRPYGGYTPHEYRHFADRLAERAGELWNKRHSGVGGEAARPISYYAAALLDNGGIENDLRARYSDANTPAMLEVLAGRAAEVGWEILTTDIGLRRRPNVRALRKELEQLRDLKAEEGRLLERSRKLHARYTRCRPGTASPVCGPEHDRIDLMLRYQEEQMVSIGELKEMLMEGTRITHDLMALSDKKAELTTRSNKYRYDSATWEPVSDSEPPGAENIDVDAIEADVLGTALLAGDELAAVRDWLTVLEFCLIASIATRSTFTRWARGEHLPTRRDKRPWEPDQIPIDTSGGPHYRRIWTPGVHEAFWRTPEMRIVLAQTLTHWPRERGWATREGQPTPRCYARMRISPAQLHLVDEPATELQAA